MPFIVDLTATLTNQLHTIIIFLQESPENILFLYEGWCKFLLNVKTFFAHFFAHFRPFFPHLFKGQCTFLLKCLMECIHLLTNSTSSEGKYCIDAMLPPQPWTLDSLNELGYALVSQPLSPNTKSLSSRGDILSPVKMPSLCPEWVNLLEEEKCPQFLVQILTQLDEMLCFLESRSDYFSLRKSILILEIETLYSLSVYIFGRRTEALLDNFVRLDCDKLLCTYYTFCQFFHFLPFRPIFTIFY